MTVQQILQQASFYSDDQLYSFVQLPLTALPAAAQLIASLEQPFCAFIIDKDEISLMLPSKIWDACAEQEHQFQPSPYRLITVDLILDYDLVGFLAYVSSALAQAGIPIMTYAAYSRDHFFVPAHQFELALRVFRQLQEE